MKIIIVLILVALAAKGVYVYFQSETEDDSKAFVEKEDTTQFVPGVAVSFVEEEVIGPQINKSWNFYKDLTFRIVSEDHKGRVKKLTFVLEQPGQKTKKNVLVPSSVEDNIFFFSDYGDVTINISSWLDYEKTTRSAKGVDLRAAFAKK